MLAAGRAHGSRGCAPLWFLFLRFQILDVIFVGGDLDRHAFDDFQAVAVQADDLFGVVGQQADLADAQVEEDLGADAIVPQVRVGRGCSFIWQMLHDVHPFRRVSRLRD